jgi:hypothetical protein
MPAARISTLSPWHVVFLSNAASQTSIGDAIAEAIETLLCELQIMSQARKSYFYISIVRGDAVLLEQGSEGSAIDCLPRINGPQTDALSRAVRKDALTSGIIVIADIFNKYPGRPTDFVPCVYVFNGYGPFDNGSASDAVARIRHQKIDAGQPRFVVANYAEVSAPAYASVFGEDALVLDHPGPEELVRTLPSIGTVVAMGPGGDVGGAIIDL